MASPLCAYFAVQSPPARHNCVARQRSLSLFLPFPFLSQSFPLVTFHSHSLILPLLLISLFPLCLCLPPPAHPPPQSTRTSSAQSSPTAPPPCCYRIMALLTTQTPRGSGYGPAKSSPDINHFTGSSLQFRDGRGDRDEGDAQLSVD